MDPLEILTKHYGAGNPALSVLVSHGRQVGDLALDIAARLGLPEKSRTFVREAAMLHDIGMLHTDTPKLSAFGRWPYICHGILGREMLEQEGLPEHALVAERHVGCGITVDEVVGMGLPLPRRDMVPVTIEEKIICYADKFYSKQPSGVLAPRKTEEHILEGLQSLGKEKPGIFLRWKEQFGLP